MSSWYSSWFSRLPSINFALPSGFQGRFISFVLKKTLGHLLKPGQLDAHQIDSQIGSGYVQINDVELDSDAINGLILDLPIALNNGSMSSIIARVPWPNPLTSTLGFSLHALRLTFHLVPRSNISGLSRTDTSLSNSMSSIAESFIHDELRPQEGTNLWSSLHPEFISSTHPDVTNFSVPGGLNPDPFSSVADDEAFHPDGAPVGVSLFSTLIERLIARFEFDAVDTEITLIHPGNISFTASIARVSYQTENIGNITHEVPHKDGVGVSRTVSISGVTITAKNLRHPTPSSPSPTPTIPSSPSNSRSAPSFGGDIPDIQHGSPASLSSSSSFDEETQFMMSQSLAFLPPRSSSPASSDVSNSMYQSAISIAPTFVDTGRCTSGSNTRQTPSPVVQVPNAPISSMNAGSDPLEGTCTEEDIVISFGSLPIKFSLTTRTSAGDRVEGSSLPQVNESLHLSVTCGIVACVLGTWHISGLLTLVDTWTSNLPPDGLLSQPPPDSSLPISATLGANFTATLNVRGVILLIVFPSPFTEAMSEFNRRASFAEYFQRPLAPCTLPQDYFRIHFDTISSSLSSISELEDARPMKSISPSLTNTLSSSLFIGDISVFSCNSAPPGNRNSDMIFSPVLITDQGLSAQYSFTHNRQYHSKNDGIFTSLPTFEITDWTDQKHQSTGIKLSPWRSKIASRISKNEKSQDVVAADSISLPKDWSVPGPSMSSPQPAISVSIKKHTFSKPRHQQKNLSNGVEAKVIPLHIFLDLAQVLNCEGFLAFLDEVVTGLPAYPNKSSTLDSELEPLILTQSRSTRERRRGRSSGKLVPEDLDLDYNYGTKGPAAKKRTHRAHGEESKISVKFDLIRLQIRCPPPPGCSARSGALIIDFHDVRIATGQLVSLESGIRFSDRLIPTHASTPEVSSEDSLMHVEFGRMLLACSPVHGRTATSVLSLGTLEDPTHSVDNKFGFGATILQPRITVNKPKSSSEQRIIVLNTDIPSVQIDVSKHTLDGLQYWVDDVTQLIDRTFSGREDASIEKANSRDGSLIGSRFFAKSRSGSEIDSNPSDTRNGTVMKVFISEAFIRAMVPRANLDSVALPFIASTSDVDILVEFKPEGRDETVFTLKIMDMNISNTTASNVTETFLSLTTPRSLSSAPKRMIELRLVSLVVPETTAKESRIKLTLSGFTYTLFPDLLWTSDLMAFIKSPPGTFESVIPSEQTRISLKVYDGSIRVLAPGHPGVLVIYIENSGFSTDIDGNSPDSSFRLTVPALSLFFLDNISDHEVDGEIQTSSQGVTFWKRGGFALLAEIEDLNMGLKFNNTDKPSNASVEIDRIGLRVHICADSLIAVTAFTSDLGSMFKPPEKERASKPKRQPTIVSQPSPTSFSIMASVEDLAFKKIPEIGPAPDMINDDLPTNLDYLDESFGTAAGLRELRDEDLDEFGNEDIEQGDVTSTLDGTGVVSRVGGETIKMLRPEGIQVTESHFNTLPPDASSANVDLGETTFRLRIHNGNITLFLYEGYDWAKTRKTIEEEVKEMRRRLAKIRQLVANGQTQDPSIEETSALLFNSLYIGLDQSADELEPGALIAAIDEELKDDIEAASQSSWQSLKSPSSGKARPRSTRVHGKRLTRSKGPSMEFRLSGLEAEVDHYQPNEPMVSRTFAVINNLEIFDHIKTSTWKKFLTELRSDSHGNIRETDSNMVRVELLSVRPVPGHPSEEARLRAKILPLRLYVDQDAVDFLKKFFSFKEPHAPSVSDPYADNEDIYFQLAEVFPINLKLDYKPRRVDYRALREGRTIELMNFFHFDGAEMTLRHITLAGITGWPRLFELLNDLWTPDVKATQLVEVISGVAPIRSMVNVGSGVADLVLLPIAQYKKDGRIVRGVQKGTTAFVKSTAIEAIKLGARLATGTQVILEQAEGILGGNTTITAEAVQNVASGDNFVQLGSGGSDEEEPTDAISKYAQQPVDIKEGIQSAYKSLQRNFNSAAQTILAVPMEVYERSSNEGPVRSVIRAVPIAVLRPMIGASEAVSQTLLGLHNTLDPNIRHDNEAKYKSHS